MCEIAANEGLDSHEVATMGLEPAFVQAAVAVLRAPPYSLSAEQGVGVNGPSILIRWPAE